MFNLGSVCFINAGNRTLLEYENDTWKHLIEFYKEKKCVVKPVLSHRKSASCRHSSLNSVQIHRSLFI